LEGPPAVKETLDQEMIETDLAKLVDDHRRCRHPRLPQHVIAHVVLPLPRKPVSNVTEIRDEGSLGLMPIVHSRHI
jgi:hypothetical protein